MQRINTGRRLQLKALVNYSLKRGEARGEENGSRLPLCGDLTLCSGVGDAKYAKGLVHYLGT